MLPGVQEEQNIDLRSTEDENNERFPSTGKVFKKELTFEERSGSRKKAVEKAVAIDANSNGKHNMNIPGSVEDAVKTTQIRWAEMENFISLELNFLNPDNPDKIKPRLKSAMKKPEDVSFTIQQQAELTVNNIRGLCGEILSKGLGLEDCETPYVSPGSELDLTNTEVKDVQEFFGSQEGARKDILLIKYFFDQKMVGEAGGYKQLTDEEYSSTGERIVEALSNYHDVRSMWKEYNPKRKGFPPNNELVRWYVNAMEHTNPDAKKKSKDKNRLIDDAMQFKGHTPKQIVKKHLPDNEEKPSVLYEETTLPDQFITKDGNIVGSVEVKAYTPREFKEWIDQLETDLETESGRDSLTDSILNIGKLGRNGLQTYITPENGMPETTTTVGGMRLGFNVDAIRKLIRVANKEPDMIDRVDPKTAEVTQEENNKEYPVILRVPSDIPDEDIHRLGNIIEKLEYRNIVVQKLPFSVTELHQLGHGYVERYRNQPNIVESRGIASAEKLKNDPDKEDISKTIEELRNKAVWWLS
jgi:hypothetical protein